MHDDVVVVVTDALVVVETGTVVVTVVLVAGTADVTEVVAAAVDVGVMDGAVVGGMVDGAVDVGDDGPVVSSPEQANATKPITVAVAMTRIDRMASFSRPSCRAG